MDNKEFDLPSKCAAETFEDGNGERTTSPAIPWAAFSTGREIYISTNHTRNILAGSSSRPINSATANSQLSATSKAVPLTIDPLEVPVSSSNLTKGLEATVDDSDDEKLGLSESKEDLQQTLSSLEFKLKAADEEKCRIKKELEGLMEKHRILETDFLKDKEATLISHQDQYNKLMDKHKLELEDLRRAGHDALAIIVEEFKALLQTVVQQREEVIEKQYISAIEKQARKCEEMLVAQVSAVILHKSITTSQQPHRNLYKPAKEAGLT
uniref:Coiled-coil domain-containing protein 91 n=1 Tax=Varanus komodoensis TaxID=61221 RepID=A0A8D2J914_VARKO